MPEMNRLTRREFLKIAGSSMAVLIAGGCLFSDSESKSFTSVTVTDNSIPVRNPAFKAVLADNRIVLYCQTGQNEVKAYALSQSGYNIWQQCLSHEDFMTGKKKSIKAISSRVTLPEKLTLSEKLDVVKKFVYTLQQHDLVFQADSNVKIYIPRHG